MKSTAMGAGPQSLLVTDCRRKRQTHSTPPQSAHYLELSTRDFHFHSSPGLWGLHLPLPGRGHNRPAGGPRLLRLRKVGWGTFPDWGLPPSLRPFGRGSVFCSRSLLPNDALRPGHKTSRRGLSQKPCSFFPLRPQLSDVPTGDSEYIIFSSQRWCQKKFP